MYRCKLTYFFFKIFPFKIWQGFLIRHHIQGCPFCQKELAATEEVKPFLIQESEVDVPESFWPAVKAELEKKEKKKRLIFRPRWRWATAAAGLAVVIALGVWLIFLVSPVKGPMKQRLVERFQINYIRIEDKPAKAYLYALKEPKMVFIWAEKNS